MLKKMFLALAIVLWTVLVTLAIMKFLKQPMIIGYILAGTAMSFFIPRILHDNTVFEGFSSIGISFLLFMVGMELNPRIIKDMGRTSLIAGSLQVIISSLVGRGVASMTGFDMMTSLFIGVGFSFSSTIVVLKLLSDKDEIESNAGRLSIGILIIQDVLVMLLMLWIATYNSIQLNHNPNILLLLPIKILAVGGGLRAMSKYIIPIITKYIAESQEFLFLFAIGRCFILGSIFHRLGFGTEIGTLIAGATLANSSYRFEITSKIKSLRDFFIVIFFVLLGSHVDFAGIGLHRGKILTLTLFVLIGKPIIVQIILGIMRHTKKNSFLCGVSLGQVSEFSFLLLTMGASAGLIKDPTILGIVTLIGLATIAGSSYFMLYGQKLFTLIQPFLKHLPGKGGREVAESKELSHDILLFGYGRFGGNLYEYLSKKDKSILVIDEHPGVITHLTKQKIDCMYGDAGDIEFLETLNIHTSKMIISTIKTFEENIILLKTLKQKHKHIIIILVSNHIEEAIKLYQEGADYVIVPHYIGVDHTSLILEEYGFNIDNFLSHKSTHLKKLQDHHKDMIIEHLK